MGELKGILKGIGLTLRVLAWFVGIGIVALGIWLGYLEARGKVSKNEGGFPTSRVESPQDARTPNLQ